MENYITFESDIERILKSLEGTATGNLAEAKNDTITSLVDSIIKTGIERRASDIHIEPMQDKVRVRYSIKKNKNHKMVEYYFMMIIISVYHHNQMYMEKNSF